MYKTGSIDYYNYKLFPYTLIVTALSLQIGLKRTWWVFGGLNVRSPILLKSPIWYSKSRSRHVHHLDYCILQICNDERHAATNERARKIKIFADLQPVVKVTLRMLLVLVVSSRRPPESFSRFNCYDFHKYAFSPTDYFIIIVNLSLTF